MTEEELEISTLRQKLAKLTDILEAERAIKRIPKNLDFVQVSRPELRAIAELGKKNSVALDVLMIFVQTMDKQNAVMMSFKAMESILGKSRPTLDRAIRILKKTNGFKSLKSVQQTLMC
ncbi:hypothetical protein [Candidatus Arsenophonus triatominarum]|uniref:hypothetical protein n=1 Tax=Candidatus Arsenophonus triatominarum TaxID=57911 RepID=UPI0007C5AA1B|nr:hypothetical protein [Candidatus Arsenophonus triatominarum]